jgi:hypothetical protein
MFHKFTILNDNKEERNLATGTENTGYELYETCRQIKALH